MVQAKTLTEAEASQQEHEVIKRGIEIAEALNKCSFTANDPLTLTALLTLCIRACIHAGVKKQDFLIVVKDAWRRGKIEQQWREIQKQANFEKGEKEEPIGESENEQ